MSEALFEKYLRNELTDAEQLALLEVLGRDEGRRRFAAYVEEWSLLADVSRRLAVSAPRAEARTGSGRIRRISPPARAWRGGWWTASVAASLLFMLGLMTSTRPPARREPATVRAIEIPQPAPEVFTPPRTDPGEVPVLPLRPLPPTPPPQKQEEVAPPTRAPEPVAPEAPPGPKEPAPAPPREAVEAPKKTGPEEKLQPATVAILERVEGLVQVVRAGGKAPAQTGQPLAEDQGLEAAAAPARALIKYEDGTRLDLTAESTIERLSVRRMPGQAEGAKLLLLTRGVLLAAVAKQPAGKPLVISTPHAEITVLGTQLLLSVTADTTRLEVQEGRVRLLRRADSAVVDVTTGHFAIAAKGTRLESRALRAEDTKEFQDGVSPTPTYAGTRDTEISEVEPERTLGSQDILKVDGDDGGGKKLYILLKWDLSEIPPTRIVREAFLTLQITDASTGPGYFLYECKRPWVESEACWKYFAAGQTWRPRDGAGTGNRGKDSLGLITAHETGSLSILLNPAGLAVVQSWIRNPASNHGFMIANDANPDGVKLCAREHLKPEQRPKLTVTFIPGASK